MTRILFPMLGMVIAVCAACSNDVEMPTPYHLDYLEQPGAVGAVQDGGVVRVSWEVASTENVAGFVVSFTDESGHVETRFVDDPAATGYQESSLDLSAEGAVYLVRVWAVDERDFYGPASAADSLTVR
jgi:hypothetical protein